MIDHVKRSHDKERRRQRDNPELSTGSNHRPSAYGCILWTGDRHPLDEGKCPTCEPPLEPEDRAWVEHQLALGQDLHPLR